MKLTTVFKSFDSAEAQLIKSMLDAAGIPAEVTHEFSALSLGSSMTMGGIRVQVADESAEEAKALIEAKGPAPV